MTTPERLIDIPFTVRPEEHGMRLDLFLSRRIHRMSRSIAAKLVKDGRVSRSGPLKASARVFAGEQVVMKRRALQEAPTEDLVIPIVYEDEQMLAVSKPGNLVVHPTASAYHRTLIRILRTRLNNEQLDLAHRLDKETSGLMLIAKDFPCASYLKVQFAKRKVEKSYLAVVRGLPEHDYYRVDASLRLADSVSNVVMEVSEENAQPALTEVFVLARGRAKTLVEARPKTGRQHQIRVHLKHIGHPIVGDKLYLEGEEFFMDALKGCYSQAELLEIVGHDRQALHAWRASFRHPVSGEVMQLSAPVPEDFQRLTKACGIQHDCL